MPRVEPGARAVKNSKIGARKLLALILKGAAVLTPVVILSIAYWVASAQERDSWLITKEFDPINAGFLVSERYSGDTILFRTNRRVTVKGWSFRI